MASSNPHFLCIASYEKGYDFLKELRELGAQVTLIVSLSGDLSAWPKECYDEVLEFPDEEREWKQEDLLKGVGYLLQERKFDRVVPLDDFDVEKAAAIREQFAIPGMNCSVSRRFRDKLAMRVEAERRQIPVPPYIGCFNFSEILSFCEQTEGPWLLKPRDKANAIGIKKFDSADALLEQIYAMGDDRIQYLVEKFVPGQVFHVDGIMFGDELQFSVASEYGIPPMEVFHEGRVFTSRTLKKADQTEKELAETLKKLLSSFGMTEGVTHTEFIRDEDGTFLFLETSTRVGGAHINELVEAASGVNLWKEWARLEYAVATGRAYSVKPERRKSAALLTCLASQEEPDMDQYEMEEIFYRVRKRYHAGLVIRSSRYARTTELLAELEKDFYDKFFASLPAAEKPSLMV
jgi:biotin carboxylase